eukprot:NODE_10422_length_441_cov_3.122449_g9313_i0.p2 GENE.NODE_10422_length_441_cov_3.122449_g9313_i0~~NODE_10422_length_441_cov_3.122449_g9313_i0.p2  ORF type:complete len:75 (-),score=5.31 NODE_10422_length_441_cov_3.122449_g9313_i0:23-247(-)
MTTRALRALVAGLRPDQGQQSWPWAQALASLWRGSPACRKNQQALNGPAGFFLHGGDPPQLALKGQLGPCQGRP